MQDLLHVGGQLERDKVVVDMHSDTSEVDCIDTFVAKHFGPRETKSAHSLNVTIFRLNVTLR